MEVHERLNNPTGGVRVQGDPAAKHARAGEADARRAPDAFSGDQIQKKKGLTTEGETEDEEGLPQERSRRVETGPICRTLLNLSGSVLFALGSVYWVLAWDLLGCLLFGGGNLCFIVTGLWWGAVSYKNLRVRYRARVGCGAPLVDHLEVVVAPGTVSPPIISVPPVVEAPEIIQAFVSVCLIDVFAALLQVAGGALFNAGLVTMWYDNLPGTTIAFWGVGSACFLLQGILGHIVSTSFTGPLLGLVTRSSHYRRYRARMADCLTPPCCSSTALCRHRLVPSALCNTSGSFLFTLGSIFLCYDILTYSAGWCYLVGSLLFVLANWADLVALVDAVARDNALACDNKK